MKKRILSIVLTLCMVLMFMPQTVWAANGSGTEPSTTAYATKEQIKNWNYQNTTGKIVFGKDSSGNLMEWYILGSDTGVSGDNTAIFATSPIMTNVQFENDDQNNKIYQASFGTYGDQAAPAEVYPNHYGASDLRVTLNGMVASDNTKYFTTAEKSLMQATTVTTTDTKNTDTGSNNVSYTTTDILYALHGVNDSATLYAGSDNGKVLSKSTYWNAGEQFWLRAPSHYGHGSHVLVAYPRGWVFPGSVDLDFAVQPASNLNLSSVIFATAASAASSDTAVSGTITSGTAMTLRLDGSGKNIGTASYNTTTGDIEVAKGSTSQTVALVVQGNDGTNDWYYSKKIDASDTINAADIKSSLGLTSDIDLSACKIWLEITDTNGLVYAVGAERTITDISSVAITDIDAPTANTALDTSASCATTGVYSTTPQVTWTPGDSTAGYNTSYTASVTLTAATGYEFEDSTAATVNGNTATSVTQNADGTLTVT